MQLYVQLYNIGALKFNSSKISFGRYFSFTPKFCTFENFPLYCNTNELGCYVCWSSNVLYNSSLDTPGPKAQNNV